MFGLKPHLHLQSLSSQRALSGHLVQYTGAHAQLHSGLSMSSVLSSPRHNSACHNTWKRRRKNQGQPLKAIRVLRENGGCKNKPRLGRWQQKTHGRQTSVGDHWRHLVIACLRVSRRWRQRKRQSVSRVHGVHWAQWRSPTGETKAYYDYYYYYLLSAYSPASRIGSPQGFRMFVMKCGYSEQYHWVWLGGTTYSCGIRSHNLY